MRQRQTVPSLCGRAMGWVMVAAAAACGGGDEPRYEAEPTIYGDRNLVPPSLVIVEGCLTAAGDRFVLTELDRGVPGPKVATREGDRPWSEAEPTTEAYRLIGMADQLQPLIGQRVEITGEAEPEHVAEVRELTPAGPPGGKAPSGTSGAQPSVSTIQTTRLEIADLRVRSVKPESGSCRVRIPAQPR